DVTAGLARPADAPDQGAEARRVHEGDRRQVDEQVALVGQLAERVAELPDGVGVELAHRAAHGVAVGLVYLDVEHELRLPGTRSGDGSGVPPPCRPPSPDRRRPVAEPPTAAAGTRSPPARSLPTVPD